MIKYTTMLRRQHGLKLPDNPSKQWLKQRVLQPIYDCKVCRKEVKIHDVIYCTDDYALKFVCKTCATIWELKDKFDDLCPPYGK